MRVGFGGGCHWCTEAVFQSLSGIDDVAQGFIASEPPDDGFSEAVIVGFDLTATSLRDLILAHLLTHASTNDHKLRGKYRSAIYTFDEDQMAEARQILDAVAAEAGVGFVTRVLPYRAFKPSDARYRGYYASNPDRPFCKAYIDPKLATLRRELPRLMKAHRVMKSGSET